MVSGFILDSESNATTTFFLFVQEICEITKDTKNTGFARAIICRLSLPDVVNLVSSQHPMSMNQ